MISQINENDFLNNKFSYKYPIMSVAYKANILDRILRENRTVIREILNIPPEYDYMWSVIDSYPNKDPKPQLVMCHYNIGNVAPEVDTRPVEFIRGIIIDMESKSIFAHAQGYIPSYTIVSNITESMDDDRPIYMANVVQEEPTEQNPQGKFMQFRLDKNKTKIYTAEETVTLMVSKYKGKILVSSQKKIDASLSRWGNSPTFVEMFNEVRNFDPKNLFDEATQTSKYVYIFLVQHPELSLITSVIEKRLYLVEVRNMKKGKSVVGLEEAMKNVSMDDEPLPTLILNDELRIEPHPLLVEYSDRPTIVQPSISVEHANAILFPSRYAKMAPSHIDDKPCKYAIAENEICIHIADNQVKDVYWQPSEQYIHNATTQTPTSYKLMGGDPVLMITTLDDGTVQYLKFDPEAYIYRKFVTGGDNNVNNQYAYFIERLQYWRYNPEEFYKVIIQQLKDDPNRGPEENLQIKWLYAFVFAVSPAKRASMSDFLVTYNSDVRKVAHLITHQYKKLTEEGLSKIGNTSKKRYEVLLAEARKIQEEQRAEKKPQTPLETLVFQLLLEKETGASMSKMITEQKTLRKMNLLPNV